MGTPIGHREHIGHLAAAAEGFAGVVASTTPSKEIVSCPGWLLRDLVWHLGSIHSWARTAIIESRNDGGESDRPADSDLADWYTARADSLIDAIDRTPIDAEVWAFCPPPWRVTFWSRRQAHETTIHLWDAHSARGDEMDVDPVLAVDGIDEVVTMFYPRQVRLGRISPLSRSLALVSGRPEPARWVLGGGDGPAEATITGPAQLLYLLVWGRIGIDHAGLVLDGDESAAQAVLSTRITP